MRGISAIALVAVGFFLGVGTFTNVSETGPAYLSFLDLRWWWAVGTSFVDWVTSQPWLADAWLEGPQLHGDYRSRPW